MCEHAPFGVLLAGCPQQYPNEVDGPAVLGPAAGVQAEHLEHAQRKEAHDHKHGEAERVAEGVCEPAVGTLFSYHHLRGPEGV